MERRKDSHFPETQNVLKPEHDALHDIERMRRQIDTMSNLVKKVNIFSSDIDDEFTVVRENGETQGIFKTWAVPVIPFFDEDQTEKLAGELRAWEGDWYSMKPDLFSVTELWREKHLSNPTKLWQTLEKWRGWSETQDGRLTKLYSERELPHDRKERVVELYWRLVVAFGYSSPFYHLEAMIVDGDKAEQNVVEGANHSLEHGGALDVVGMALPSALKNVVVADELDWNGLNWEMINTELISRLDESDIAVTTRVAKELGVGVNDVIFAANVLEWIPASVGGKKQDFSRSEASTLITDILQDRGEKTTTSVARDMNALIRFLNWFPLVKSDNNFANGEGWRYAAVCDTANKLLAEIQNGGVYKDSFDVIFIDTLVKQVQLLDATSAKGRFLLQTINEGKLREDYQQAIEDGRDRFMDDIATGFVRLKQEETVLPTRDPNARFLVGGKAAGLREAMLVFGEAQVVSGVVVTTEAIEDWLRSDDMLWALVKQLDGERDLNRKSDLGSQIRNILKNKQLLLREDFSGHGFSESGSVAVRSSSFDEDTFRNGAAAGVYESVVPVEVEDIDRAVVQVVSSFFSEKAINFRSLQGFSDRPLFAVEISQFVKGRGGAAFSTKEGWELVVGESPADIVGDGGNGFDSYKKDERGIRTTINMGWIDDEIALRVGKMVERAEKVLGEKVDLEFVVDDNEDIRVLQLRSLGCGEQKQEITIYEGNTVSVVEIDDVSHLGGINVLRGDRLRLVIGENVDIGQFQGELFRWMVVNRGVLKEMILRKRIPRTSHFANICLNLGIKLSFDDEN